jgi:hypothetical protein
LIWINDRLTWGGQATDVAMSRFVHVVIPEIAWSVQDRVAA